MCLMNSVLCLYLDKFVIMFIDDILVYYKNYEEHVEHLATTLRSLREHPLYSKLNNCNFLQTKLHYLGHVVSKDGIVVDPEKIRASMEWEAPRNAYEVRSFMGLAGYCRRFIRNFSQISYPITSLQRKGNKFEWKEEFNTSFEQLRQLLTHAQVLKIVDLEKKNLVCIDACKRGFGGILMKDRQVVCYESRKLNLQEQNYATHDLELAVIIHALKIQRHYIIGRRFVLMSDHSGLWYLFYQPNLNGRLAQWLAIISEFDFEIRL